MEPPRLGESIRIVSDHRDENGQRLSGQFTAAELVPGTLPGWLSHAAGVVDEIAKTTGTIVGGVDLYIESTVPVGAGLSSSHALEVAVLIALDEVFDLGLDDREKVLLTQRAENDFVGAPTGIVDQAASIMTEAGYALFLDCRDLSARQIPFDLDAEGLRLLVIDSKVSHSHSESGYGARRKTCEESAAIFGVDSLRELADDVDLSELTDEQRKRVRHVIAENARVRATVELLEEAHAQASLKGLMLASPANPTGTMIGAEALGELVDWCREHGVQVISDEIYHGISYIGTRGECALAHDDDAIVISSFSKYWGMTGWRLGWAILPEPLVAPAQNVTGNLSLCAPVPAQYAAVAGFTEESYAECEAAVASSAGAREHVLSASRDLGFGEMAPPDGAFYMYTKIDEILDRAGLETSGQWCEQVLDATGVALAPGDDFDSVDGSRAVRLSLAVGADRTAEAIDRILDWLE